MFVAFELPFFPERASSMAGQTDYLFYALCGLTLLMLTVVFVPMFFFLYRYRADNDVDRTPSHFTTWKIELTWSVIPLWIVLGVFFWGAGLYVRLRTPPPDKDTLEINVIGKQWMWNVQHPEGKRELNEMHVPVGRTVRLLMTSQDVIHDFYVPAFRTKQDVVPGQYTEQWFKATKTGSFHLFCSKLCGSSHAEMGGWVTVMTPSDYQRWLNQGGVQASLVARGERLFRSLGCSGCHGENGVVRCPSLHGLYGHPVPLDTGEIVTADDHYIHDSILLPQKQIVASYAPVMPSYEGQIGEEEVFQLVQYIKSMASDTPDEYLRQNLGVAGQTQVPAAPTQNVPPGTTPGPTQYAPPGGTPVPAPTPPFEPQPTSH